MFCKKCGKELSDNVKICKHCGEKNNIIEEKSKIEDKEGIVSKENDSSLQEMKKKNPVLIVIITIVCFIIGYIFIQYLSEQSYTPDNEDINKLVADLKENFNLPQQIDEVTTLTNITSNGRAIRYQYVLSNVDTTTLSNQSIKSYVLPNVCKNNDIVYLLKKDINLEYYYLVNDSLQTYLFTINRNDCSL